MGQVGLVTALLLNGRCLIDPVLLIVKLLGLPAIRADRISRPSKTWVKKPGMVEKSEQPLSFDWWLHKTQSHKAAWNTCCELWTDLWWLSWWDLLCNFWVVCLLPGGWSEEMENDKWQTWRAKNSHIYLQSKSQEAAAALFATSDFSLVVWDWRSLHSWCKLNLVSIIIFVPSSWQDHTVVSQI